MSRPKLILIADDQAILEFDQGITKQEAERYQEALNTTMKKHGSLILASGLWDIVDRRRPPDIEMRLAAVEKWIQEHDVDH